MPETPDVSILMSVWNDERWLRPVMDSILAQTHTNFEVLITDDCSPDNSWTVMQAFRDPRIRIFRHTPPRLGLLDTINEMAHEARGRIIHTLCPDDTLAPDCLATVVAHFHAHPEVGYTVVQRDAIDETGNRIDVPFSSYPPAPIISGTDADHYQLLHGGFGATSCMFIPRDRWSEAAGYRHLMANNPEKWPTCEDGDLKERLQANYPVGLIQQPLIHSRMRANQASSEPKHVALVTEANVLVERATSARLLAAGRLTPSEYRQIWARKDASILLGAMAMVRRSHWRSARALASIIWRHGSFARAVPAFLKSEVLPRLRGQIRRGSLKHTRSSAT